MRLSFSAAHLTHVVVIGLIVRVHVAIVHIHVPGVGRVIGVGTAGPVVIRLDAEISAHFSLEPSGSSDHRQPIPIKRYEPPALLCRAVTQRRRDGRTMIKRARSKEPGDVCRHPSDSGLPHRPYIPSWVCVTVAGFRRRRFCFRVVFNHPSFCLAKLVIRSATCK